MRLSRESRYAIEGLVALAAHPAGAIVDARTIAQDAGLPLAFLHKILRMLTVGGIVSSHRGKGFSLARSPGAVTMREVLSAVEGPGVFGGRCIFWREECSVERPCELHFRWSEVKDGVEDAIARTTLEEIAAEGMPAAG